MRGFYTRALDAEAAAEVTMADVADTHHRPGTEIRVPLADPFDAHSPDCHHGMIPRAGSVGFDRCPVCHAEAPF